MKIVILFLTLLPTLIYSDVIESDKHGFTIKIERTAKVDVKTAYQQFLKVGEWWNAEHTWFGEAKGLYIEPEVGGCFCEKLNNKQALHMTISYIDPENEIRLTGGLGPLQMLGVNGGMSWKFIKIDEKTTQIIQQYQVVGFLKNGMDSLAPIVNTVQTIQIDGLIARLNQ